MATGQIAATEGSGKNIATNSISEDALTKQLQRVVSNDSTGTEKGTTANPQAVSIIGLTPVIFTGQPSIVSYGIRNDTMSSITATDNALSPHAVGGLGETLVANAPLTKWVQGFASIFNGVSVVALAAQGTSIFTYITSAQIVNNSPNNVYVTFTGGLGGVSSVLGYLPAPANSGAIPLMVNGWKTGANSGVSASISGGVASVYISLQGFISKT